MSSTIFRRSSPPARFSSVDIGDEVVLTYDGTGVPQQGGRVAALYQAEQLYGADSCELYHVDYSYRAVKTVLPYEQQQMKEAQERVTIPVHYGAQPDLGRYSRPDGPWATGPSCCRRCASTRRGRRKRRPSRWPWPTWSTSPRACGRRARRHRLRHLRRRRRRRLPGGADRCGDATRPHPDLGIEVGMAGEIVLGTHGQLEYDGVRLAASNRRARCKSCRRPAPPSMARP